MTKSATSISWLAVAIAVIVVGATIVAATEPRLTSQLASTTDSAGPYGPEDSESSAATFMSPSSSSVQSGGSSGFGGSSGSGFNCPLGYECLPQHVCQPGTIVSLCAYGMARCCIKGGSSSGGGNSGSSTSSGAGSSSGGNSGGGTTGGPGGSSSGGGSSSSFSPWEPQVDLSVILDTDQTTVPPNGEITYTVKVLNAGPDDLHSTIVAITQYDFLRIHSSALGCASSDQEPTYMYCEIGPLQSGGSQSFTVTLRAPSTFTCPTSVMGGSAMFALVAPESAATPISIGRQRFYDPFPMNNTSNIVNTMPACP
jgi:hypothetical protein